MELYGRDHEVLLNQRAYIRALANAEKKDQEELAAGLDDVERALSMQPDKAAFIDTRGYLLYLLGQYDEALNEMKRAIALTEDVYRREYHAADSQRLREDLAVMYYHLALIQQAKDQKRDAEASFQLAEEYGYNPEAGVL
jgi:tetratricopeptide (TPR) repeat protein